MASEPRSAQRGGYTAAKAMRFKQCFVASTLHRARWDGPHVALPLFRAAGFRSEPARAGSIASRALEFAILLQPRGQARSSARLWTEGRGDVSTVPSLPARRHATVEKRRKLMEARGRRIVTRPTSRTTCEQADVADNVDGQAAATRAPEGVPVRTIAASLRPRAPLIPENVHLRQQFRKPAVSQ
jgi:hypothetical protein